MKNYIKTLLFSVLMLVLMCTDSYAHKGIFEVPDTIGANDFAAVMKEETKIHIETTNEKLMAQAESKIIFVTVPTTNGEDIDTFAKNLYSAWGVKNIGDTSSTFVLYSTEDMNYWAMVGDHLRTALDETTLNNILLQYTEPDFAKKDFDSAIKKTYDAICLWYTSNYNTTHEIAQGSDENKNSTNTSKKSFWSMYGTIIVVVILIVIALIVKRKIKLYQISQKKRQRIMSYKKHLRKELEMKYKK